MKNLFKKDYRYLIAWSVVVAVLATAAMYALTKEKYKKDHECDLTSYAEPDGIGPFRIGRNFYDVLKELKEYDKIVIECDTTPEDLGMNFGHPIFKTIFVNGYELDEINFNQVEILFFRDEIYKVSVYDPDKELIDIFDAKYEQYECRPDSSKIKKSRAGGNKYSYKRTKKWESESAMCTLASEGNTLFIDSRHNYFFVETKDKNILYLTSYYEKKEKEIEERVINRSKEKQKEILIAKGKRI